MKKIIIGIVALIVIGALGWAYYTYASQLPTYSRSVAESVIIDKTDPLAVQPSLADVLAPLNLSEHKWEQVRLNISTFSEYKLNEKYALDLPGQFFLWANPGDRDKDISLFGKQVDSVLTVVNRQNNGYPKSSIYAPLLEEVNRLAATKAELKNVLVYTDGCENTDVFSIYRDKDRELLTKHPEKVRELLSRYGKPGNLHGVSIYFLFKPRNDIEDRNFSLMSGFYKQLFEAAGAEVHIGANLITENK